MRVCNHFVFEKLPRQPAPHYFDRLKKWYAFAEIIRRKVSWLHRLWNWDRTVSREAVWSAKLCHQLLLCQWNYRWTGKAMARHFLFFPGFFLDILLFYSVTRGWGLGLRSDSELKSGTSSDASFTEQHSSILNIVHTIWTGKNQKLFPLSSFFILPLSSVLFFDWSNHPNER